MKRITTLLSIVSAVIVVSAVSILAAENCPISSREYDKLVQSNFKNQCLLVAKNCGSDTYTVQERATNLRAEIAKGRDVYTAAELRALREQLQWIETDSANQVI